MSRVILAAALAGTCPAALGQATAAPAPPADSTTPWRSFKRTDAEWARSGWWNDSVFYQIFVRSFADSSVGPLANDGVGDFQGIIERLDYLNDGDSANTADLGVTALWLLPIHPCSRYHGYDVKDFMDVNPQFGAMDDFKRLLAECHKRGIRVVLDLVLNHVSWEHPWFVDASRGPASPFHDWFIWTDKAPDWRGLWNQQVWWRVGTQPGRTPPVRPGDADGPFYFGMFHFTMPDLNYRNQAVTDAMLGVTRFWLADVGIDGYRLDAIRHLIEDGRVQENTPETHAWLRGFFTECKKTRPDAFTIGEVWSPTPQLAPYVGDELGAVFEFDLSFAMIEAARTGNAERFLAAQRRSLELLPPGQYGRFLTNHDQARVMTALKGDDGAMRTAAMMLLLGPGVPFLYYGEEIGMRGDKPDERIRTPMPWTGGHAGGFTSGTPWQPLQPGFEASNVASQSADPGSLLSLYRDLIRLRSGSPALSWGLTTLLSCDHPSIVAILRTIPHHADRPTLVLINLGAAPAEGFTLAAPPGAIAGTLRGSERWAGESDVADLAAAADGSFAGYGPVPRLEPRSARVIEYSAPER